MAASILLAIGLSVLALAWGFLNSGLLLWANFTLILGLFWAISNWLHWKWFAPIGYWAVIILAVFGLWQHVQSVWAILSILGILYAWDISDFLDRTVLTPLADQQTMNPLHVKRLLVYAFLAILFISLAFVIQLRVSLEWAMVLTAIVIVGVMGIISRLRQ